MKKILETAVNVATLITCTAILVTLGQGLWARAHRPQPIQPFHEGDRLPVFNGLELDGADRTLVMVLRHDCRYCAESLPFYQSLSTRGATHEGKIKRQIAILTGDDPETARHYVSANRLNVSMVVSIPEKQRQDLKVTGTPTLMLVDRAGVIRRLWIGKLDAAGEQEVKLALQVES